MPIIDLHDKPFDEFTITKLNIFEQYTQAWLPTFVMQGMPKIYIFDFFAGTGYDTNGVPGSPIRILKVIKQYVTFFFQKNVKIEVFFNEFNKKKFIKLKSACEEFLELNEEFKRFSKINYYQEDFEKLFPKLLPRIAEAPSLVFLDQNGVKFSSINYFHDLARTTQTDFLYFVSSSYIWRFRDTDAFKKYLDFAVDRSDKSQYKMIHRLLVNHLRNTLSDYTTLKLLPFSLKKGTNFYGLVFGAKHYRAVEKFLDIAWKQNGVNGDANFDIDEDIPPQQLTLFPQENIKISKIQKFNELLEAIIRGKRIVDSRFVYGFTLDQGHCLKHGSDLVKELKKAGRLEYEGRSPKIKYEAFKNDIDNVTIKWIGN